MTALGRRGAGPRGQYGSSRRRLRLSYGEFYGFKRHALRGLAPRLVRDYAETTTRSTTSKASAAGLGHATDTGLDGNDNQAYDFRGTRHGPWPRG